MPGWDLSARALRGCRNTLVWGGGPCHVFLSSTVYTGELAGLSGADAKCQGLAGAARLPGTYRAWLSATTSSPSSRFVLSTGPYRQVNGTTIAANFTDLTDGNQQGPINGTETGGWIGSTDQVWTHTRIDGTAGGLQHEHYENWTTGDAADGGDDGDANRSNPYWTLYGWSRCDFFGTSLLLPATVRDGAAGIRRVARAEGVKREACRRGRLGSSSHRGAPVGG